MTYNDIKQLMRCGEIAKASAACEEILKQSPDDVEIKLLYGTCRQILGDTDTFQRIYAELAPTLDPQEAEGKTSEIISQWANYKKALRYLTAAGLVFAASAFLCGCYGVPAYNRPYEQETEPSTSAEQQGNSSKESPHETTAKPPAADSGR